MWPFKRKQQHDGGVSDAIDAFWSWWAEAKDRVALAIEEGRSRDMAEEISQYVNGIDESLAWELGPGVRSQHHLCVTSEGDWSRRILAERWLARAPKPDDVWEYYPARQSSGVERALELKGVRIDFADFRVAFEIDENRERIHVQLYHPEAARLDEDARSMIWFLCLDNTLGEDEVEAWIGAVEPSESEPEGSVPLADLVTAVSALREASTGESFCIVSAETEDGDPIVATVNLGLKRVHHLLLDTHYEIVIALEDPADNGLTTDEEAQRLNRLEDALLESIEPDAVYIGRETYSGLRVIHLHASDVGPVPSRIDEWRRGAAYDIEVQARPDPEWDVLGRW